MPRESAPESRNKFCTWLCHKLITDIHKDDFVAVGDSLVTLNRSLHLIARVYARRRSGLIVFVRQGQYRKVPMALLYTASYVEESRDCGGYVHKHRDGTHGPTDLDTENLLRRMEWEPLMGAPQGGSTWHARVLRDDLLKDSV